MTDVLKAPDPTHVWFIRDHHGNVIDVRRSEPNAAAHYGVTFEHHEVISSWKWVSIRQQADAWQAVWAVLSQVVPGFFDFTESGLGSAVAAIRDLAARAHPRPTGDVPRYTHLPVDLWEAIAKNSVWLMRNARDGHYTLDQAIQYQLGAIATGRDPAPTGEQAGEVVGVDSVAYRYRKRGCGGTWRYGSVSHRNAGHGPDTNVFEIEMLSRTADAQPRPMGVPDGWRLVPLRSTDEMHRAYTRKKYEDREGKPSVLIPELWEAMLAAAPAPGNRGEA